MSNRKRIFFTSDWHLYHKNVIDFSNRPFRDLDHMHEKLINNYNSIVSENSVCYFLGDFNMGGSKAKAIVDRLNGTKVLILGNHDKNANSMYGLGFDVVMYNATLYIAKQKVTLSHAPLVGLYREDITNMKRVKEGSNWHGELHSKMEPFRLKNEGQFHLHGHCHAPNNGQSKVKEGRQWDVGVDGNDYRPVSLSRVESWICKTLREENEQSNT